jgi:hypothetical protein
MYQKWIPSTNGQPGPTTYTVILSIESGQSMVEIAQGLEVPLKTIQRIKKKWKAYKPKKNVTRKMSDERFQELVTGRIHYRGGVFKVCAPFTKFEGVAMSIVKGIEAWGNIPWEKILCQSDDKGEGYLIRIVKNNKINLDKEARKEPREVQLSALGDGTRDRLPAKPARSHEGSDYVNYSNDVTGPEYDMPEPIRWRPSMAIPQQYKWHIFSPTPGAALFAYYLGDEVEPDKLLPVKCPFLSI